MQEEECILLAGPFKLCRVQARPEKKGQWDQGQQDCRLLLWGTGWVPCSPQTLALPPPESCLMGSHPKPGCRYTLPSVFSTPGEAELRLRVCPGVPRPVGAQAGV